MATDWTKIYKKYKGLWVGLQKDEKTVAASGRTVKEVLCKSQKKGVVKPLLLKVPSRMEPYIGASLL